VQQKCWSGAKFEHWITLDIYDLPTICPQGRRKTLRNSKRVVALVTAGESARAWEHGRVVRKIRVQASMCFSVLARSHRVSEAIGTLAPPAEGLATDVWGMVMNAPDGRVRVVFRCRMGHDHELCVSIGRPVPPQLHCTPGAGAGYGAGGGAGCTVPADLQDLVWREFRDALEESKRRGYVFIRE
jgi:hypothetical protein